MNWENWAYGVACGTVIGILFAMLIFITRKQHPATPLTTEVLFFDVMFENKSFKDNASNLGQEHGLKIRCHHVGCFWSEDGFDFKLRWQITATGAAEQIVKFKNNLHRLY